jgi:hypothetical protein
VRPRLHPHEDEAEGEGNRGPLTSENPFLHHPRLTQPSSGSPI